MFSDWKPSANSVKDLSKIVKVEHTASAKTDTLSCCSSPPTKNQSLRYAKNLGKIFAVLAGFALKTYGQTSAVKLHESR